METPPRNIGRTTRRTLMEIQDRRNSLSSLNQSYRQTIMNVINISGPPHNDATSSVESVNTNLTSHGQDFRADNVGNNRFGFSSTNMNNVNVTPRGMHSLLTPSPSPEELIIQMRGKRKIPTTFSPDIDELKRESQARDYKDRTPVKQTIGSPGRYNIVLRSTPRKRLMLTDLSDLSPSPKKIKPNLSIDTSYTTVSDVLKLFNVDQLISIMTQLVQKHPDLESDIKSFLPTPDLRSIEDNLNYLKRNIYKSIPRSRLMSKTDGSAYNRASSHVFAFKKCLVECGQRFYESKQWSWILEYFIMAWKILRCTPIWDTASHNLPRKQCFRILANYSIVALKNGKFTNDELKRYERIMTEYLSDSEDLEQSLKYIETRLKV